jgi:hypothetical protein
MDDRQLGPEDFHHRCIDHIACFLPNIFIKRVGKCSRPFDDDTTCTQSTKIKDRIHAAARGGDVRMMHPTSTARASRFIDSPSLAYEL